MVQISRKKLSEERLSRLITLFFETVGKRKDRNEFQSIINDLFSETERIMIIKRVAIFYLLLKNIDQRTIANVLKVSIATVAKFSLIAQNSQGIIPYLKKVVKSEKIFELIEDMIAEYIFPPNKYQTDWKLGWKLEFERQRKKTQGI